MKRKIELYPGRDKVLYKAQTAGERSLLVHQHSEPAISIFYFCDHTQEHNSEAGHGCELCSPAEAKVFLESKGLYIQLADYFIGNLHEPKTS